MDYALDGSSSNINKAYDAFLNTFHYFARKVDHNSDLVISELMAKRPVYMRGDKSKFTVFTYDGHAWVCDGLHRLQVLNEYSLQVVARTSELQYKPVGVGTIGEGYILTSYHMNWGWNQNDAWYADLDINIPSINSDFKYDRQDIINIQPNR